MVQSRDGNRRGREGQVPTPVTLGLPLQQEPPPGGVGDLLLFSLAGWEYRNPHPTQLLQEKGVHPSAPKIMQGWS